MKSALLIWCVLSGLVFILTGCQSSEMVLRDGQCCYDHQVVQRTFSIKGTQWRQPRFKTEQVCYPCDVQAVCPADAGTVCEPCK